MSSLMNDAPSGKLANPTIVERVMQLEQRDRERAEVISNLEARVEILENETARLRREVGLDSR